MGLKVLLDSIDELSDEQKALYVEKDGKFLLDIEDVDSHPKVRGLVTANNENRRKRDEHKAALDEVNARLEGLPEDFGLTEYETLKEAAEGKGGAPTEEQLQAARDKIKDKLEKKHADELRARDERIEKLDGSLKRIVVDEALTSAMDAANIDPQHRPALKPFLKTQGKIVVEEADDQFKAIVDADGVPTPLTDYVQEWAGSEAGKIYVAKSTGPNPKGGQTTGGGKTISRAEFDALSIPEQGAKAREGIQIVD